MSEAMAAGEERDDVRAMIRDEGFHYALRWKTDFRRVKDARFHELLAAYLAASKALANYVGCDE